MVTGDNVKTAKAIALECGILHSDVDASEPYLIEGKAFRALSDMQREEVAEKICVCSRSVFFYEFGLRHQTKSGKFKLIGLFMHR